MVARYSHYFKIAFDTFGRVRKLPFNSLSKTFTMRIELLQDMKSCVTDGERIIPKGTIMQSTGTCLTWTYFEGAGFRMIIMGGEYWGCVKIIG